MRLTQAAAAREIQPATGETRISPADGTRFHALRLRPAQPRLGPVRDRAARAATALDSSSRVRVVARPLVGLRQRVGGLARAPSQTGHTQNQPRLSSLARALRAAALVRFVDERGVGRGSRSPRRRLRRDAAPPTRFFLASRRRHSCGARALAGPLAGPRGAALESALRFRASSRSGVGRGSGRVPSSTSPTSSLLAAAASSSRPRRRRGRDRRRRRLLPAAARRGRRRRGRRRRRPLRPRAKWRPQRRTGARRTGTAWWPRPRLRTRSASGCAGRTRRPA